MTDTSKDSQSDRWRALSRYDPEIAPLADHLAAYGAKWIDEFEKAFFALKEDRSYLNNIFNRLVFEAETEVARAIERKKMAWFEKARRTYRGEDTTERCLYFLLSAMRSGFVVSVADDHSIEMHKTGLGSSFLYSNSDIERFAAIQKLSPMGEGQTK